MAAKFSLLHGIAQIDTLSVQDYVFKPLSTILSSERE